MPSYEESGHKCFQVIMFNFNEKTKTPRKPSNQVICFIEGGPLIFQCEQYHVLPSLFHC